MRRLTLCRFLAAALTAITPIAVAQSRDAAQSEAESERESELAPSDRVLVRGDRSTPSREPTAAATELSGREIETPGMTSAQLLERATGVQTTRAGSSAELATASIRGANGAHTSVYLAGVKLNNELTGVADLSAMPLFVLDRVEVFRGSALLGSPESLPLGGAIYFEPRLPRGNSATVGAGVGSFGAESLWGVATVSNDSESAQSLLAVRATRADNDYPFLDDRGTRFVPDDDVLTTRENADFQAFELWAISRLRPEPRVRLLVLTHGFLREQGVTGLSVIPAKSARAKARRLIVAVSSQTPCRLLGVGSLRSRCQVRLNASWLHNGLTLTDPNRELALVATRVDNRSHRLTRGAEFRLRFGENTTFATGGSSAIDLLEVSQRNGTTTTTGSRRLSAAAFGTIRTELVESVDVVGQGVASLSRTDTVTGETPFLFTGRAGLRWQLMPELEFLTNIARAAREPTLGELYGISVVTRGNPALRAETGVNVDAGLRYRLQSGFVRASVEGFAFARFADGLIVQRRSGFMIRPFNVGSARVLGAELSLKARWHGLLRTEGGATFLEPRDTSADRPPGNDILPYRSRLTVFGLVGADWESEGPISGSGVAVRAYYRSSRFADIAGLIVIPASAEFALEAYAALDGGAWQLRGAVENVLDNSAFDSVGFPLPGRSFNASLEKTW
jgi:vitamin B12 transporter